MAKNKNKQQLLPISSKSKQSAACIKINILLFRLKTAPILWPHCCLAMLIKQRLQTVDAIDLFFCKKFFVLSCLIIIIQNVEIGIKIDPPPPFFFFCFFVTIKFFRFMNVFLQLPIILPQCKFCNRSLKTQIEKPSLSLKCQLL